MSGNYKTVAHSTYIGACTFLIPTNAASYCGTGGINGLAYCRRYRKRLGWIYGSERMVAITVGVTPYYRQTLKRYTEVWRRTSRGTALMVRTSMVMTHRALITLPVGGDILDR